MDKSQEKQVREMIEEFWSQWNGRLKDLMYDFFCFLIYKKADFLRGVLGEGKDIENEESDTMDIYSRPGTKIRFLGKNGYPDELKEAQEILKTDVVYTVRRTEVHSFRTWVWLEELPSKRLNAVMFANASDYQKEEKEKGDEN